MDNNRCVPRYDFVLVDTNRAKNRLQMENRTLPIPHILSLAYQTHNYMSVNPKIQCCVLVGVGLRQGCLSSPILWTKMLVLAYQTLKQ